MSFTISPPIVSLHEPVYVEFSVHNGSDEPVQFDLGLKRKTAFEFTVTEPNGKTTGRLHLRQAGFGASGHVSLPPGRTYTQKLVLNEWYEFPGPGDYRVQAMLVGSSGTRSGATASSPSQELDVHVGPRSPQHLVSLHRFLLAQPYLAGPIIATALRWLAERHDRGFESPNAPRVPF